MAFTITVNNDDNHTLTFSKNTLARRNEANVSVTVVVPAAVFALGSFAYIDFILPDGSTYFKGDYDPSSGSFTFTLGSADTILSQDGKIGIQFVLRDSDVLPTVVWKSELKYALIGSSADATAQALTGIPTPATFPATFPATNVSIVDAGAHFASPDVEDALQEVGAVLTTNTADITALETATTAANLLAAIKTVDGAGSGLDADLLDGQTGAYYATATQPTATAVTSFLNSWVNYAGGFQAAEYWKDTLGYVHIHGVVKSGTINQPIFQLPTGYKPPYTLMFAITSNGAAGSVYIENNGDVKCVVGNNAWVSLCGISFKV